MKTPLYIYHVSQSQNNGYDTYSDFVICAPDEETARNADPSTGWPMTTQNSWSDRYNGWCNGPEHVEVKLVGNAVEGMNPGIICSSFHAG
jgi:hypothetical protein